MQIQYNLQTVSPFCIVHQHLKHCEGVKRVVTFNVGNSLELLNLINLKYFNTYALNVLQNTKGNILFVKFTFPVIINVSVVKVKSHLKVL